MCEKIQEIRKFPICDADFWIKVSKLDDYNLIPEKESLFNKYNKVLFSDAVTFEIKEKALEDDMEFGSAYKTYKTKLKDNSIIKLDVTDKSFFTDKELKAIQRQFVRYKIDYDFKKKLYKKRSEGLGEKVSIIYAEILSLTIFLSDDREFRKDYIKNMYTRSNDYIEIMNVYSFLKSLGMKHEEAMRIKNRVNLSKEKFNQLKNLEQNGVDRIDNFSDLKVYLMSKGAM